MVYGSRANKYPLIMCNYVIKEVINVFVSLNRISVCSLSLSLSRPELASCAQRSVSVHCHQLRIIVIAIQIIFAICASIHPCILSPASPYSALPLPQMFVCVRMFLRLRSVKLMTISVPLLKLAKSSSFHVIHSSAVLPPELIIK